MIERLRTARSSNGYRRWEQRTDGPLLALALVFLGVLVLPLLADLEPWQETALSVISAVIWAVFAVDYLGRLYLSPSRWTFVRTHVIDLVAIALPLLRPLRALRLLRLLSLFGIAQGRARRSLQSRITAYVGGTALVVIVVSAVAIREVERDAVGSNIHTLGDGLWWAVTTVTTVGYGDRYPITPLGRLIAVTLMVVGIALLGVITASVAAWFVTRLQAVREAEERTEATLADVLAELHRLHARLDALSSSPSAPRAGEPSTTQLNGAPVS